MKRKWNNRGQVLVTFLLLLPLVLLFLGIIMERCYLISEQAKIKSIADLVCSEAITKQDSTLAKELAYQNDSKLTEVDVKVTEKKVSVKIQKEIPSIFGHIIGISNYSYHTSINCEH